MKLTNQKGRLEIKNGRHTLRYRERDSAGHWSHRRVTLEPTTAKEAQREAARLMLNVNQANNSPLKAEALTYGQFIGDLSLPPSTRGSLWQGYLNGRGIQKNTQNSFDSNTRKLLPFLKDKPVSTISPGDITTLMTQLRGTCKPARLNTLYRILSLQFRVLADHDKVERSPVRASIHRVAAPEQTKPTISLTQFNKLVEALRPELKLPVLLMGVTGIRSCECFGFRWSDFDHDRSILTISGSAEYREWKGATKTKATKRAILLPGKLRDLLQTHRMESQWQEDGHFIFSSVDGRIFNHLHFRKFFKAALASIGVTPEPGRHGYHLIRHSVGRIAYELSENPKAVQMMLGHARLGTTMDVYCHPDMTIPGQISQQICDGMLPEYVN